MFDRRTVASCCCSRSPTPPPKPRAIQSPHAVSPVALRLLLSLSDSATGVARTPSRRRPIAVRRHAHCRPIAAHRAQRAHPSPHPTVGPPRPAKLGACRGPSARSATREHAGRSAPLTAGGIHNPPSLCSISSRPHRPPTISPGRNDELRRGAAARRHAPGLTPSQARNERLKCASSEKPDAAAASRTQAPRSM